MVGIDWGGRLGTYLPCRRNLGWMPSWLPRASPLRSVSTELGSVRIKLCYGSPSVRGRRLIGGAQVPFGRLWRTGANEPTILRLSGPISIAGIVVNAPKVAIYSVPGPETWEIIVNRATSQWGLESEYSPVVASQEIGRSIVPSEAISPPVEELEFAFEPGRAPAQADLVLSWESTRVRIPIQATQDTQIRAPSPQNPKRKDP